MGARRFVVSLSTSCLDSGQCHWVPCLIRRLLPQAPVPKEPWEGVWNSTVPGKVCFQVDQSAVSRSRRKRDIWPVDDDQQSEDCLVLDVHTPKVRNAKRGKAAPGKSKDHSNPSPSLCPLRRCVSDGA